MLACMMIILRTGPAPDVDTKSDNGKRDGSTCVDRISQIRKKVSLIKIL